MRIVNGEQTRVEKWSVTRLMAARTYTYTYNCTYTFLKVNFNMNKPCNNIVAFYLIVRQII